MSCYEELIGQRDRLCDIAKKHFGQFLAVGLGKDSLIVLSDKQLPQEEITSFLEGGQFKDGLFEGKSEVRFIATGRAFA
jgi:hypothetical protein